LAFTPAAIIIEAKGVAALVEAIGSRPTAFQRLWARAGVLAEKTA
jgi:hypothetical protein